MTARITLRSLRDMILDLLDPYKPSEARFHPNLVALQILMARNTLRARDAGKDAAKNGDIDDAWFTDREVDILFDERGGHIPLPSGVVNLPNDLGVRVIPVSGLGNPFVHYPDGWCSSFPELAFAEGNIPWELHRGEVRFPTMTEGTFFTKVIIGCIEDSMDPSKLDEPLAMPSEYQFVVQEMVIQRLTGASPEDRKADAKPLNAS